MTEPICLADLTTIRLGGPIRQLVETTTEADFIAAIRAADADGSRLLVLGGGSNIIAADAGFDGVVVRDLRQSIEIVDSSECAGLTVNVAAGTPWDAVVAHAVEQGWSGLEALSGIPGSTGATPVQNVGAYGQEVSDVVASVRTWDREHDRLRTFALADLGFGYRTSIMRRQMIGATPQFVVLDVQFQLRSSELSAPIRYTELARRLGVEVGDRAEAALVRATVLELRAGKGMVLDDADHDTWSAGSFFTNPILDDEAAASLTADAPRYPVKGIDGEQIAGLVKTSAAWLIQHAGFERGYGLPGPVSLSTKHTLALTNRGGASTADLLAIARTVRSGVHASFGVTLVPEPILLGCEL